MQCSSRCGGLCNAGAVLSAVFGAVHGAVLGAETLKTISVFGATKVYESRTTWCRLEIDYKNGD